MNAVNSEHQKNLTSDFRKIWLLTKHISDKSSIYNKFPTGNMDTLNKENIM